MRAYYITRVGIVASVPRTIHTKRVLIYCTHIIYIGWRNVRIIMYMETYCFAVIRVIPILTVAQFSANDLLPADDIKIYSFMKSESLLLLSHAARVNFSHTSLYQS